MQTGEKRKDPNWEQKREEKKKTAPKEKEGRKPGV